MTLVNKNVNRRRFLKGAAAVTGAALVAPWVEGLGVMGTNGRAEAANDYGPLHPVKDLRDNVERLALPEGFQYRSFSVSGQTMTNGIDRVPLAPDGMASFVMSDGTVRLVRNSEDRNGPGLGGVGGNPATKYDALGGGGCTTLVVNPENRQLMSHFISQNGSIVNCAGGATPWGSWITCEETNAGPPTWGKQHGYAFDVPASANTTVPAVALTALGRFAHEAIAVDPTTWIVYETEDNATNSGFYRFVADTPGNLTSGKLQMLAVDGVFQYQAIVGQEVGKKLPVKWVDIANPNPAGTSSTAVFSQGLAAGGARFARLEGCWYGSQSIYFVSTNGGNNPGNVLGGGAGQVWQYRPDGQGNGFLTLIFESPNPDVLDAPDNLTVSPNGAILLCEDGDDEQFLRGITSKGEIFDFALNLLNEDEWAGATFALHGKSNDDDAVRGQHATLFANLFGVSSFPTGGDFDDIAPDRLGMTVAIWGPWKNGAL